MGSRCRMVEGRIAVMVRAMGPSPEWAETRRASVEGAPQMKSRRGSGARPKCGRALGPGRGPFRPRGAQIAAVGLLSHLRQGCTIAHARPKLRIPKSEQASPSEIFQPFGASRSAPLLM